VGFEYFWQEEMGVAMKSLIEELRRWLMGPGPQPVPVRLPVKVRR